MHWASRAGVTTEHKGELDEFGLQILNAPKRISQFQTHGVNKGSRGLGLRFVHWFGRVGKRQFAPCR